MKWNAGAAVWCLIGGFNPESVTQESSAQCIVGSPPYLLHPQIIGAEDDYFDSQQEQVIGGTAGTEVDNVLDCDHAWKQWTLTL